MESIRSRLQSQQHGWGDHPNISSPPATRDAVVEEGFIWCTDHHKEDSGLSRREHMNTAAPAQAHPVKVAISTKDWTLHKLIASGERFHAVPRVSALAGEALIKDAIKRYEDGGEPMIISDWHRLDSWPTDMFSPEWLLQNGDQRVNARNCLNWTDKEMTLSEFIEKSRNSARYAESTDTERFYGKDATCPPQWEQWIEDGPLPKDLLIKGPHNIMQYLPESEKIEHLMCYLGIGDTFTPAHKDLCGSSGHNLMCYTENNGSSFWFMTESSSASAAALYFQSLNHELDHEQKVITPEELAKAPFKVYITEQKLGDLVLVPKRSCHQVVNNGGLTIKASWSRMTIDGLVAAFYYELPIYRRVCRKETYRVKTLCHHALMALGDELRRVIEDSPKSPDSCTQDTAAEPSPVTSKPSAPAEKHTEQDSRLGTDVQKLLEVFGKIIKEEYSGPSMVFTHGRQAAMSESTVESEPKSLSQTSEATEMTYMACDFCGADIFQSFFECMTCATPEPSRVTDGSVQVANFAAGDPIIICPGCYIEGRSCLCTKMIPRQCRLTEDLFHLHNRVADMLNSGLVVTTLPKWYKAVPMSWIILKSASIRHPRLFEAACLLWEARQSEDNLKKPERSCLPRFAGSRGGPHIVPRISALSCKKCHNAKCFTHIIEFGIHASEALIKHVRDPEHEEWHAFHLMERGKVDTKHQEVKMGEVKGKPVDANYILMVAAQRFTYCHPLSPKTVIGWYDDGYHNPESFIPYAVDPDYPNDLSTVQSGTSADDPPRLPITVGQQQTTSAPLVFAPGVESPPRRRTANAVLIHSQTTPRKVVSVADAAETEGRVDRLKKRRKLEPVVELFTMAALGKSTADYHPMEYYYPRRGPRAAPRKLKPVSTARAKRVVTSDIESEDSDRGEERLFYRQKPLPSIKLLVNKPSANKPPISPHQRPLYESQSHFVGGSKVSDKTYAPNAREKEPWGPKRFDPEKGFGSKPTSTAGPSRSSGSSLKPPITPKSASKQVRNPVTSTTSFSSPTRDSTNQPSPKKPHLDLHFKKNRSNFELGDVAVSSDQRSPTPASKHATHKSSHAGPSSSQSPTQPPPYGSTTSSDQMTEVLTLLKSLQPEGGNHHSASLAPSDRGTDMLATILPVIKALRPDRRLEDSLTIEGQAREIQSLKDQLKAKDEMMETLRKDIALREEALLKANQSTQDLQSAMNNVLRNTHPQAPVILQVHSHGLSPPISYAEPTQQMNQTDYNYNQSYPHAWRSRPRGHYNSNGYPGRNDRTDYVNNWERKFTHPQQRQTRFDQNNNINYSPRTAQQKRRFTDGSGVNGEWMTQQNRYPGRQTSRWPYERHNNDYGSYPYHAHQSTDGAWNATGSSPSKAAESSSSANVDDAKRATSRELVAVPRAPLPLPVHGRRVDAEDEDINVDAEYLVREEDERDLERSPLMSRPEGSSARIQEVEDDVDVHPQQPEGQYPRSEPARPSVPPSEIDADDHRSHSVNRQLGFVPSDQFGTGVWESALIKKKI